VFTALQAGGSDIYHYDLASGAQSPVATKSFVEQAPAIDGNLVAWEVVQGAASDIWARRLDGQSFLVATSAACEDQPAVGGSYIAYRIDGQDIAVYDEQTGQTVRVTDDAYVQQSPRVADGLVYYMDNRAGNFDLYAYDLARGCTYQLTDEPHDQYLGDADGDRIAYHDNRSGANDVFLLGVRMNRPPVADAGADFVMDHQPEAKLLRGGSDPDPEDGPRNPDAIAHFDVCWHIVSAPVGCGQALAVPQDQYYGQYVDYNETGDAWFRPRVDGQYVISLALFDGIDWGEPDTVTITVTGASNAPVVDAGPDREVEVGYNARLFGSYHSDYAVREIVWSILLAPDGSTAELDYYFGPLSPELLPDVAGTYVIQLRVVDENGVWGEDWVTLVAWYNARPHVYAGADREVEIGQLVELHAVAWDPENDPIVAWRWQLNNVPDGSLAELSDDWIQDPTFVPDVPGLYELRAWAYDDAPGAHAGHDDMVVTATPVVNDAPIANAGPDQFAYPGRVVPLEGSAWDEEGSPITAWEWTVQSAPPGSTATLSNPASQTPTFTPDLVGEYVLALRAHDDENWGEPDTMTITTLDQSPPIAVAGPDRVAPVNTPVPLDGVASYDPDGDVITRYQWTLVSVPPGSAAELADAQAVVADLLADVPGAYVVALEVYDGRFWSAADSVTVTVQDYFPLGSAPGVTVSDPPVDRDGRGEATISGDVIVYSKIVNMNNDLYWCEVGGGAGALITAAGNQFWPDISGTGVAYTDDSTGMLDIWYCDVRTQEKYRVSPSWMSDYEPAISGTNIVYTSTQNFNEDVYWYSTVKHAELPLANTSNAERFPAIDGELVAWVVYEGGNANIRARFLEQPPFAVAVTAAAEMYPSVSGLRIAYQVDYDIAVYDHATGQTRRMAPVASDLRNVTLSGDKLYYTGTRASSYDVFLHDLATGNTYQLTTGKLAVLSDADGTRAVYDPGSGVAGGVYLIEVAFNHRPVADAGPDRDALTEAAVQLNGSASSDPDGDVLVGHFWTIMDAPASSTARLSDPHAIDPTFTPEVAGSYTVGLCVSDGGLWSAVDRVVITAAHVNHAPTADAGPDQAARVGEVVQLDGAGSSDPDPGDEWLTYHWVISVKPSSSTAVLSAPSIRNPTFTPDVPGTFVIELMVFDGEVWSAPDTVTLTVRLPNRPPVAIAGANQNVMTHALVQLHGAGYDADHDPIAAWSWQLTSQPAGSPAQLSDPAIRSPTFTAHWPGEYVLELIVSDGLLWSAPAEVRVTAEQNHTPVAVAGPNQTVHAGEIVQLDGSGSGDPDGQPIAAWKWTMSRRPAGSLAALSDPAIPKPTFQTDLPGRYEVWLDVWDESGAQGQSHYPVVVEALQPNQPPIAEAGEDQRVAVGRVVCLDAIGSIDPDGDAIIAWAWQFLELPAGSAATLSDANTGQPTFTPDVVGEYVVSLVVQAEHNEAWSLPDALWVIATEPTANTFDAGAEGWRWADLEADGPYPTVYQTGEVTWQAEGGNPGGCIAVADPGPEAVFFAAPASWLGPKGQAYGTNLTFDLRASGSGTGSSLIPEIVLVGAGRSIVANLQVVSASPSWQTFALPLSEAGWKYDDPDTGAPVTPEDFRAVLADLERLYLCADYVAEPETTYLDNVRMFVSASGDFDGDGDVDESDAAIFEDCLAGPEYARPPVCMVGDLDGDGDVDLADFALLQSVYTGPG
jgi:Tol biopolymer transport system component